MAVNSRMKMIFPEPLRAQSWQCSANQIQIYNKKQEFTCFRPVGLEEFNRLYKKVPAKDLELRENRTDQGRLCWDIYCYGNYEARLPSYFGSVGDKMPITETMWRDRNGNTGYLADLTGAQKLTMKRDGKKSMVGTHKQITHSRYIFTILGVEIAEWRPFPENIGELEGLDFAVAADGSKMWKNYLGGVQYFSDQMQAYSSFVRKTYGTKVMEQNKFVWKITGVIEPFEKEEKERFLRNGGIFMPEKS